MKISESIQCLSDDNKGIIQMANRYFTNIGLTRNEIKVIIETPVLFYGNNPGGG